MERENESNSTDEIEINGTVAMEHLARRLHREMEHLDPSDEPQDWDNLPDRDKSFYRQCIREIARDPEAVLAVHRWRSACPQR
jgi:hypothetical protein